MTLSRITDAVAAHYSSIDQRSAAQAVELVRALRDQLYEMTRRLAWLERQGVAGTNGRASATRCEAAALRLDINEAQILIDRLQRRYLNSDRHAQTRRLYDTKLAEPSRAQTARGTRSPFSRPLKN